MHNKTKGACIGGAIGFGFGGPFGAALGAVIGGAICNTDILDDFIEKIKEHAKLYAATNHGKLKRADWEYLYQIMEEAKSKDAEKYGRVDNKTYSKKHVKELVREVLAEE